MQNETDARVFGLFQSRFDPEKKQEGEENAEFSVGKESALNTCQDFPFVSVISCDPNKIMGDGHSEQNKYTSNPENNTLPKHNF